MQQTNKTCVRGLAEKESREAAAESLMEREWRSRGQVLSLVFLMRNTIAYACIASNAAKERSKTDVGEQR